MSAKRLSRVERAARAIFESDRLAWHAEWEVPLNTKDHRYPRWSAHGASPHRATCLRRAKAALGVKS